MRNFTNLWDWSSNRVPGRRSRLKAHLVESHFGDRVEELEPFRVLTSVIDTGVDAPAYCDVTEADTPPAPTKISAQGAKVERAVPNVQGDWDINVDTDTGSKLHGTAEIKQTEAGKIKTTVQPDGVPFKFKLKGKFYEGSDTVSGRGRITDPSSGKVISVYISLTATDNNHIDGNLIIKVGDNPVRLWTITGVRK